MNARPDFIVPVVQLDVNERWNALPMAFAVRLAQETGARVIPTVVQTNVVHHTSADSFRRFLHQPEFAGKAPRGTYVILDDVVTMGSTLANLRGHIEHQGGTVLAAHDAGRRNLRGAHPVGSSAHLVIATPLRP